MEDKVVFVIINYTCLYTETVGGKQTIFVFGHKALPYRPSPSVMIKQMFHKRPTEMGRFMVPSLILCTFLCSQRNK